VIHDLLHDSYPTGFVADICIVGAGAVGITLAVESARRGKKVLLLEGGGALREESSQQIYDSEIVGLPHRGIHTGRIRVKGGTTVRWGGQILELDALDFTPRPGVPESGWPFPKSTLISFYERALTLEGLAKATPKSGVTLACPLLSLRSSRPTSRVGAPNRTSPACTIKHLPNIRIFTSGSTQVQSS